VSQFVTCEVETLPNGDVQTTISRLEHSETVSMKSSFDNFMRAMNPQWGVKVKEQPLSRRDTALNVTLADFESNPRLTARVSKFVVSEDEQTIEGKSSSRLAMAMINTMLKTLPRKQLIESVGKQSVRKLLADMSQKKLYSILFSSLSISYSLAVEGSVFYEGLLPAQGQERENLQFLLEFAEDLAGLSKSSIVTEACEIVRWIVLDKRRIRFYVIPKTRQGYVGVKIPGGVAVSQRNSRVINGPASFRFLYSYEPPTLQLSSQMMELVLVSQDEKATSPNPFRLVPVRAEFSVSVRSVQASDFLVEPAFITDFRAEPGKNSDRVFLFNLNLAAKGHGVITLPAGNVNSAAGVPNPNDISFSYLFEPADVFVTLSNSLDQQRFFQRKLEILVSFSEPVASFTASDFDLVNCALAKGTNFRKIDATNWELDIVVRNIGEISVSFPAGSTRSLSKQVPNLASDVLRLIFDPCQECQIEARDSCKVNRKTSIASCECPDGFTGNAKLACLECPGGAKTPCSGNGKCVKTSDHENRCECNSKYGGRDCSVNMKIAKPQNLRATFVNFTSFRVSWAPQKTSQDFKNYRITVTSSSSSKVYAAAPEAKNYLIGQLSANTDYTVQVGSVFSLNGEEVEGAPAQVRIMLKPNILAARMTNWEGSTSGGDVVRLDVEKLVPISLENPLESGFVKVFYGPEDDPELFKCEVFSLTQSSLACKISPGVGTGLLFIVHFGEISSTRFTKFEYAYAPPEITSFSLRFANLEFGSPGNITGTLPEGDELKLEGKNFGALVGSMKVKFGGTNFNKGEITCKVMKVRHTWVICKIQAGIGKNLATHVSVAGQSATPNFFNVFSFPDPPTVSSVSGCLVDPRETARTVGCSTPGGTRITVQGYNFGFLPGSTSSFIDGVRCDNLVLHNSGRLTCDVPSGVGGSLSVVVVASSLRSGRNRLLSYSTPSVLNITGCPMTTEVGAAVDCPNDASVRITIEGLNFGVAEASVLVGLSEGGDCLELFHDPEDPHRRLSCRLPPGRSTQSVFVVQRGGGFSRKSGTLSYVPCPPGTHNSIGAGNIVIENKLFSRFLCSACERGRFSDGSTQNDVCLNCPKGRATNLTKTAVCPFCPEGRYQDLEGEFGCKKCQPGRYTPSGGAKECGKCADMGNFFAFENTCYPCLEGADCVDGVIQSRQNYWISTYRSRQVIYRCAVEMCGAGQCEPNREGPMCGTCQPGYYPLGKKCSPCSYENASFLILLIAANYVLVAFLFNSSKKLDSPHDIFLKIFLYFNQSVLIMFTAEELSAELNSILGALSFGEAVGGQGASTTTFCYQASTLFNLYMALLTPVLSLTQLVLQAIVSLVIHRFKTGKFKGFHTSAYRRASLMLFVTSYYAVVQNCFRVITCVEVGNEQRLQFQPSILCDDPSYLNIRFVAYTMLSTVLLLQFRFSWVIIKAMRQGHLTPKVVHKVIVWYYLKDIMDADRAAIALEERRAEKEVLQAQEGVIEKQGVLRGLMTKTLKTVAKKTQKKTPKVVPSELQRIRAKRQEANLILPWFPEGMPTFGKTVALYQAYGTLLMPYHPGAAYWEFLAMFRRALMIFIALGVSNIRDRFCCFGLVALMQLSVHCFKAPYRDGYLFKDPFVATCINRANRLELFSFTMLYLLSNINSFQNFLGPLLLHFKFLIILVTAIVEISFVGFVIARAQLYGSKFVQSREDWENMLGNVNWAHDIAVFTRLQNRARRLDAKRGLPSRRVRNEENSEAPEEVVDILRQSYNEHNGFISSEVAEEILAQMESFVENDKLTKIADLSGVRLSSTLRTSFPEYLDALCDALHFRWEQKLDVTQGDVASHDMILVAFDNLATSPAQEKRNSCSILDAAGVIKLAESFGVTVPPSEVAAFKQKRSRSAQRHYASFDVLVQNATNVPKVDLLSESDPYLVVTISRTSHRTRVIDDEPNPYWNENFTFKEKSLNDSVMLELYDEDSVNDQLISRLRVSVYDLLCRPADQPYVMKEGNPKKKIPPCHVYLKVTPTPLMMFEGVEAFSVKDVCAFFDQSNTCKVFFKEQKETRARHAAEKQRVATVEKLDLEYFLQLDASTSASTHGWWQTFVSQEFAHNSAFKSTQTFGDLHMKLKNWFDQLDKRKKGVLSGQDIEDFMTKRGDQVLPGSGVRLLKEASGGKVGAGEGISFDDFKGHIVFCLQAATVCEEKLAPDVSSVVLSQSDLPAPSPIPSRNNFVTSAQYVMDDDLSSSISSVMTSDGETDGIVAPGIDFLSLEAKSPAINGNELRLVLDISTPESSEFEYGDQTSLHDHSSDFDFL